MVPCSSVRGPGAPRLSVRGPGAPLVIGWGPGAPGCQLDDPGHQLGAPSLSVRGLRGLWLSLRCRGAPWLSIRGSRSPSR